MFEKYAHEFSQIKLFTDISRKDLSNIAGRCIWKTYHAQQPIVMHHDKGRDVYFVVVGRARVSIVGETGREVILGDLESGQWFGELSAIDGHERSASVLALSDAVIASVAPDTFNEILREYPDVAAEVMRYLAKLVRNLTDRVFELSTRAVKLRIMAEILRLTGDRMIDAKVARVAPAPTHAELAARLGTHREAVTREFGDLTRKGLIKKKGADLFVYDVPKLKTVLEELITEH